MKDSIGFWFIYLAWDVIVFLAWGVIVLLSEPYFQYKRLRGKL